MINFFQQIKKMGNGIKSLKGKDFHGFFKKINAFLVFIFFNKRHFLSLIAGKEVFTFVPYSSIRKKHLPMSKLKITFPQFVRPGGQAKALLLLLAVLGCFFQLGAQGWEIYFGGPNEDFGHAVIQTRDLGYVVAGFSESFGPDGDMDVYVIRTDVDGTEIWSEVYDDGFIEHGYGIVETPDDGFLIVGDIWPTQLSNPNVYLLKIDSRGKKLWSKQFGGGGNDVGYRIIPTSNGGGYLIVGTTNSFGNGLNDVFLIKIDEQGNQIWAQTYGTTGNDTGRGAIEMPDGYLVTGTAFNPNNGTPDLYLLKTDFAGNEVWSKFFGSPTDIDEGYGLVRMDDGNIALTGYTNSLSDILLMKVTPDGEEIWTKTLGGDFGDQAFDIIKTTNGNLVVTGISEIDPTNSDAVLARFDPNGNLIWFERVGRGSHVDLGQSVAQTHDGGFIITGYNSLFGSFINDVTLIKTGENGTVYTNHVTGRVFMDGGDCVLQPGEMGLGGWIIRAASANNTFFGTTDADGHYDITVANGTYTVSVLVKNSYWEACIAAYNVTFNSQYDTLIRNFPILPVAACPLLEVDVSTAVAQGCSNMEYIVSFCNSGPVEAGTPSVHLILGNGLSYISSSIAPTSIVDSLAIFDLGPLGTGDCGTFSLIAAADCTGQPGQAYVVSAHIFPDSICLPVSPGWDMASIKVNGYCDTDSVRFLIRNDGTGNMAQPSNFIVIEDQILGLQGDFILNTGQTKTLALSAEAGKTYRIIAEQSAGHPGNSYPTVAVEGCSQSGSFSTGYVAELQEDENDPFVSIDVQEGISSTTDYIFLRGYPKGYFINGENLIPANTGIEYHIYFQNAGIDTIDRLVIRDTLPGHLDIGSVVAGASSHPYDFEVYGGGILKFTFDGILLPPGGGAASQGFVKFKVAQKPNNPAGTKIQNSATVFLGFDAPFQTDTYTHVVGGQSVLDFLVITDVKEQPEAPGVSISAYPNPFASAIEFEVRGRDYNSLTVSLFDMSGQLVRREMSSGNFLRLQRNGLPSGTYAYRLEADGLLVGTGKIIVR